MLIFLCALVWLRFASVWAPHLFETDLHQPAPPSPAFFVLLLYHIAFRGE